MPDWKASDHLGRPDSLQVFWRSLFLVGTAELFDKTWFMGLLLAMRFSPAVVFMGSFTALFLHSIMAASFGIVFSRLVSPVVLDFAAAALFGLFSILYAKDFFFSDPDGDVIAAGQEGAAGDCGLPAPAEGGSDSLRSAEEPAELDENSPVMPDTEIGEKSKASAPKWGNAVFATFWRSFVGVFIAECGDRTQIAMVGQHASQPLVPVFLGSVLAFFLLTLSAVSAATCINDMKLSERVVFGISSVLFALFAGLAVWDGVRALADLHAATPQVGGT